MAPPRLLSIIIVSFNTRELLRRCLTSLVESPYHRLRPSAAEADAGSPPEDPAAGSARGVDIELLVVDNGSSDGSADMVQQQFPVARLIRAETNLGFARATNVGLREGRGDLLLLLNPDTEVIGDALVTLAGFVRAHRRVAAAGPSLVYPDGRPQAGAFRFPSLWMSFFDFFPLHHRLIDSRLNGRYRVPAGRAPFAVDHPLGAAMLLRREAMAQVGLLDESFFMYCEEVDWCLRAKRRGWKIYQVPSASIVHHSGQSTGQFREEMLVQLHRSRYILFRRHYSRTFIALHRAVTRLGVAKETARAVWGLYRRRLTRQDLTRRLQAYRAIWSM